MGRMKKWLPTTLSILSILLWIQGKGAESR